MHPLRPFRPWRPLPAALALLLALAALPPGVARGGEHDGGFGCEACHALDAKDVQPGTRFLSRSAMLEFVERGWRPGASIPCTFCHRSSLSSRIPDALSHFAGKDKGGSRHPVSRDFNGGGYDNTPYLSSDNSATPGHLDCRDCHDTTLVSVPNHDRKWLGDRNGEAARNRSTNPFGLRLVTSPKGYDDLCRACHRDAASFRAFTGKDGSKAKRLVLLSHDNGADLGENAIRDRDNTLLRTSTPANVEGKRQCAVCHDGHRSRNGHLFSDGHELDNTGTAETAIDEVRGCAVVCHYRGDRAGGYDLHGHGKKSNWAGVTLARDCTFCHDPAKPHDTRSTEYADLYRLPRVDPSWTAPSVFGRAVKSVCSSCHGKKGVHTTKKGVVGCLDCHDPHGKNSDNNVMMIRNTNRVAGGRIGVKGVGETVGSEVVYFWKSPKYPQGDNVFHFFTNEPYGASQTTSAGFCDQRACHGLGYKEGFYYVPLDTYMGSGKHSGGVMKPNSNCEACHSHDSDSGSFGAIGGTGSRGSASLEGCSACHGFPPPPADNQAGAGYAWNEALTPHVLHASTYRVDCRTCHEGYTDPSTHNTKDPSYQDVEFSDNVNRGKPRYDPSSLECSSVACHSDGRGGDPNEAPRWIAPPAPGTAVRIRCDGCHGGDPTTFPDRSIVTAGHRRHLSKGIGCAACHVQTSPADCSARIALPGGVLVHGNGTPDVSFPYSTGGAFNSLSKDCSSVSCHGGDAVNWYDGLAPDVGQYFDRKIRRGGSRNYDDNSSHPLVGLTDGTAGRYVYGKEFQVNCLECHYGSGPSRTSDECLKCHFEGGESKPGVPWGKAPATNHGDGILQLARIASETDAPASQFPVATLADYNGWCLQCHDRGSYSLGGIFPSAGRRSVVDGASFRNSRHQLRLAVARVTGCITCHAPHGEGNAQLVRHNAPNRAGAGPLPLLQGLFPKETLDSFPAAYSRFGPQNARYLARVDNVSTPEERIVFADAADADRYCNRACHNLGYPKDRMIVRDNSTGNYLLTGDLRKQYAVGETIYPKGVSDPAWHSHVSCEAISTDDMVRDYAAASGTSGPAFYHYPDKPSSDPAVADREWNVEKRTPLPFFPDLADGDRDFEDGHRRKGRILYRFVCSTCHNVHGTAETNTFDSQNLNAYPDLRVIRRSNALCVRCHS